MKTHSSQSKHAQQYLIASLVTLALGVAVMAGGVYMIEKLENNVMVYKTTFVKDKDK